MPPEKTNPSRFGEASTLDPARITNVAFARDRTRTQHYPQLGGSDSPLVHTNPDARSALLCDNPGVVTRRSFCSVSLVAALLLLAGVGYRLFGTVEQLAPGTSVYEFCGQCDLARSEIDGLIDTVRSSPQSRAQLIDTWRDTACPSSVNLCQPGTEAIIDEARPFTPTL